MVQEEGNRSGADEMELIESIAAMQDRSEALRLSGRTIGFVPTMGFLHEGHLELMRIARRHSDIVVTSIFVNPTQFGPGEDLDEYPRDMEGDMGKARSVGVDILFHPSAGEMYGEGFQSLLSVRDVTRHLCGLSRPGHFDGVTTVVAKLFNIVKPHIAVFGQKDYQQLTVISRMVRDMNMDVRIIGVPTVREADGLAMSSRNNYLSSDERASALSLKKAIDLAREMAAKGQTDALVIKEALSSLILNHPFTRIDYVSLCHPDTLEEVESLQCPTLLALAVRVGKTRLIDNAVVSP